MLYIFFSGPNNQGDSFDIVFDNPWSAFQAASCIQSSINNAPWSSDIIDSMPTTKTEYSSSGAALFRGLRGDMLS